MSRQTLEAILASCIAILAAGSAGAGNRVPGAPTTCPILGATLTASAEPNSYGEYVYGIRPETKEFDGQRFTVTRATGVKEMTRNPATGDMRDIGYEAVGLQSPKGPLIIREQKAIGAPPQWTFSRLPKDAPGIRWGQGPAWKVKVGETLWTVQEGPLAGYTLQVSACPPPGSREGPACQEHASRAHPRRR